jgi:hypothetical protein
MIPKLEDLKRLLWEQWDPIGVCGGGPDDEYDSYAYEVWMRLKRGASTNEIADYLRWAETEHMGLSETPGKALEIARKAVAISD